MTLTSRVKVIADPNASRSDKMMAGLNVGLAALFEAAEPDDFLPAGLPLDDAARKAVMKGAKEAFEEGGEEAVEKYIRNGIGEHADDVLNRMGISNFADPGLLTDHFLEHGAELGYRTERDYLPGTRNLTKGGEGIEKFFRKSDGATLFYKATQEFVILHKNGAIGTYMHAKDGWVYWLKHIKKGK